MQVLSGVQAISAGDGHSLFLKTDGTVWAAGANSSGQLGDGTTTSRRTPVQALNGVQAISAGSSLSLFLKTDGTVWATGYDNFEQFGDGAVNKSTPVRVMQLIANPGIAWKNEQFGQDAADPMISGDEADPDQDGVVNLLERAFNLSPIQAGASILVSGTGNTGLPLTTTTQGPDGPVLNIQFIRRKSSTNSGLNYVPQFSSSLDDGDWSAAIGVETVESIDTEWERVTVTDSVASPPTARFGRVKVTGEAP